MTKYKKEKMNFKYLKRRIRVTNISRCNLTIKETLKEKDHVPKVQASIVLSTFPRASMKNTQERNETATYLQ